MTDLFSEAARDIEAERFIERCALAKVAVADLWPFLALAMTPEEFDHRLALAGERIAGAIDPELLEVTLTALRRDFADLAQFRAEEDVVGRVAASGTREPEAPPVQPGQQIWHHARQAWVTVAAGPDLPHQPATRDNPYGQGENYFENAVEEGPNTGQPGGYPQFPAGPDPVDPLNSMFPMQPSAWTVPPDKGWVERPMQLSPGAGRQGSRLGDRWMGNAPALAQSAVRRVLAGAGYTSEGVETGTGSNADFFAGGTEGVGGDPQNGYPEDLAAQDPDDRVNELYGGVPPQPSAGSGQGGAQPYSNPGVARQSVRHTAPGGGEHAPYEIRQVDGGYAVFNAKGERKNDEPKSEENARQFQKALYANVPGASESAKAASFFDPSDPFVQIIAQIGDVTDVSGGIAPEPPQSMMPGGVGSMAQPPLGSGEADPSGVDAASKMPLMGMPSIPTFGQLDPVVFDIARAAAAQVRERPTDLNPSGVADEFDDNTWDSQANARPRQSAGDRNINTPQTPRDQIPQTSSTDVQRELSEDEERLRRASLRATQLVLAGGAR